MDNQRNHSYLSVSVIIPYYNREKFFEESLNSILAQTHQPNEIIIVDDGSTAASSNYLARFANEVKIITLKKIMALVMHAMLVWNMQKVN